MLLFCSSPPPPLPPALSPAAALTCEPKKRTYVGK
jgi:hypothetical protein